MNEADLLVVGRIATLAGDTGYAWAEAMAVGGGRVLASGARGEVQRLAGLGTRRLILGPDLVLVPGLADAHLHLADAAMAAQQVQLEGTATLQHGLAVIAEAAAREPDRGQWLQGGGWDPALWGRWPTAADLRGVAPDRLVALWSHDHHALWVSDAALRAAGIDAGRADPPGGAIRRDATGAPTGVLQEAADELVMDLLPEPSPAALEEAIRGYAGTLLTLGIVAVHDPGDILADDALRGGFLAVTELADRGELPIRVHASIRAPALRTAIERGLRTGAVLAGGGSGGRARMGWLKLFADGALGSRTAHLLEPYEGTADDRGIAVSRAKELANLTRQAAAAGIVTQIHAIGDAAFRVALDALGPSAPRHGPMARVEHVQFADPADLPRLAANRIGASIQPIHLRTDLAKAHAAWGERAEARGFLLRSLFDAGATVGFGSDAPVEPADPWPGLALAVTRISPEWPDRRPFGPDEAIALPAALRAATVGPALLAGDPLGGRLVPGSPADFIAVPRAALEGPVEAGGGGTLAATRPAFVAVEGSIVFEA